MSFDLTDIQAADYVALAIQLSPEDAAQRLDLRARLGILLTWALRFDEAVRVAQDAAARLAATAGAASAARYLAQVVVAAEDVGGGSRSAPLLDAGIRYSADRRDDTWAISAGGSTRPGRDRRPGRSGVARRLTRTTPDRGYLRGVAEHPDRLELELHALELALGDSERQRRTETTLYRR